MPKEFNFAAPTSGSGANKEKPGIVYPPEIKAKLDKAMAQVQSAKTLAETNAALEKYKKEIAEASEEHRKEQERRMELVEFRGEQIHRFELEALQSIIEQINEDYAEQRKAKPDFETKDLNLDDVRIKVEENEIIKIDLVGKKLTKIPKSIGELTNLQRLYLESNQISRIEGLDNLTNLQKLYLYSNQISRIEGLDNLTNLQTLWLDSNRISRIEGLDNLTNLRWLFLQLQKGQGIDVADSINKAQIEKWEKKLGGNFNI